MRAIIVVLLAILFRLVSGNTVLSFSSKVIKKEAIIKVHNGLPSLEAFTERITRK